MAILQQENFKIISFRHNIMERRKMFLISMKHHTQNEKENDAYI